MDHPAREALCRFLQGTASREENRTIVRHLLARCPRCAVALNSGKPEPAAYDEALSRSAARLRELAAGGAR
jgi:hypothetical protein